jgi:hypothetical protein
MSILSKTASNLSDHVRERRSFVRDRVEQDRLYLREQGLQRRAAVQETRTNYERTARALIRKGADEQRVLGMMEMDPDGLMQLYDTVKDDSSITGANLNDMFAIREDYDGEATMDEVLNKILPVAQAMPNDTDPLTTRRNSVAAWLGMDLNSQLESEVYSQEIVGGMTGDQIIASMNLPVTAVGSDTSGVTYDFSRAEPLGAGEVRQLLAMANEEYGDDWVAGQLASLQSQLSAEGLTSDEVEGIQKQIDALNDLPSGAGAARLEAILALPGVTPGPATIAMANKHGTQLFSMDFGFKPGTLASILGTEEENIASTPEEAEALPDGPQTQVVTPPDSAEVPTFEVSEEDAERKAEDFFSDPANEGIDSIVLNINGTPVTIQRATDPEPVGNGSLWDAVNRRRSPEVPPSDSQPSVMTEGPNPLAIPEVPTDMSGDDFSRMVADTIVPEQRKVLEGARISQYPEPSPTEENKPLFQGRPNIVKTLMVNEDMEIDALFIDSVFEDLGIKADSEFGNQLSNMLLRDFRPEDRKAGLEFLMNQYELFESRK